MSELATVRMTKSLMHTFANSSIKIARKYTQKSPACHLGKPGFWYSVILLFRCDQLYAIKLFAGKCA